MTLDPTSVAGRVDLEVQSLPIAVAAGLGDGTNEGGRWEVAGYFGGRFGTRFSGR